MSESFVQIALPNDKSVFELMNLDTALCLPLNY